MPSLRYWNGISEYFYLNVIFFNFGVKSKRVTRFRVTFVDD